MQRLTIADNKTTIEFKGLNRKLPPREQKAMQYIIDSFTGKMPTLIPFALENKSFSHLLETSPHLPQNFFFEKPNFNTQTQNFLLTHKETSCTIEQLLISHINKVTSEITWEN